MIHINKTTLKSIDYNDIINFDLRSDIENNNIYDTNLVPVGLIYRGADIKDPSKWAIELRVGKSEVVHTYIYTSISEYERDVVTVSKGIKFRTGKYNTKEIALVCAYIAYNDLLDGTIFNTFDRSYEIAKDFLKVYPVNFKWGINEEWDETLERFVSERYFNNKN